MKDNVMRIVKIVLFFFSLFLVFWGQKTVGRLDLFVQLIGLSGLLFLLWDYNRKFI
ncbi:DUF6903 family protein [Paucisalibacillus globulus]|jgi:hypothetical protein|uniref:DUF6903 family protein n=1 Tax=Paucisalibacillus globulus TaxID=351095 RepID=UPI00041F2C64|nr:hypothetical protein [Paucisalibacillus globulus]